MSKTAIEWTQQTWNPVTGCSKVSPGCAHCYAETVALRFWSSQYRPVLADGSGKSLDTISTSHHEDYLANGLARSRRFTDVQCHEDRLAEPLRRKKPTTYFVNSMSDLFHEHVPDAFIDRVFAVMALAPRHTFQILTKRADRMRAYLTETPGGWGRAARIADAAQVLCGFDGEKYLPHKSARGVGKKLVLPSADVFWVGACNPPDQSYRERWIVKTWPLPNVWLGVSVENQHFADERVQLLLQTPAAVRFLSCEPLLGPLNFRWAKWDDHAPSSRRLADRCPSVTRGGKTLAGCIDELDGLRFLDWVIVGGESGPGARPLWLPWVRLIVQQCKASGVACFVKQLGADVRDRNDAGFMGEEPDAWPDHIDQENRVEHDLDGTHDGYQGAPVRVHLKSRKGGDPLEWPEDLRVRQMPKSVEL